MDVQFLSYPLLLEWESIILWLIIYHMAILQLPLRLLKRTEHILAFAVMECFLVPICAYAYFLVLLGIKINTHYEQKSFLLIMIFGCLLIHVQSMHYQKSLPER